MNEKINRLQGSTLQESLKNIENEHRSLSHEALSVVSKDGRILMVKEGKESSVSITAEEKEMMRGCVLTHNHPNGSCFSSEDITLFVNSGIAEMRATRPDGGAFSIKKTAGSYDGSFARSYRRHRTRAKRRAQIELDKRGYSEKIKSGEIRQSFADQEMYRLTAIYNNQWLSCFAKIHGYAYARE